MVYEIKLNSLTTREKCRTEKEPIYYNLVGSAKELIWNRRIRFTWCSSGWLII